MIKYLFLIFFISATSYSHPGKRSKKDDCHYCKNNCESLGLTTNTRHAHSNKECDPSKGPIDSKTPIKRITKAKHKYHRNAFKHWIDIDKDCQNTRSEILIERSKEKVSFKKRKNKKECTVLSGKWDDFYYPETLTLAKDVDVDHIVPLKNAWISGASYWSKKQREKFANDPENLVLTNKKYNRQKGAKTPLEWTPAIRAYNCKYLEQWIYIKRKYKLRIDPKIYKYQVQGQCN